MTSAISRISAIITLVLLTLGMAVPAAANSGDVGAVYTLTNAAAGNAVVSFTRAATGELSWSATYPTGGAGSGAGLGSQGAVITSDNGRWLYAVDAGSNDIATFAIRGDGLELVGRVSSGGTMPISLTASGDRVYVLNAGSRTIAGFTSDQGTLSAIPGSTGALLGSGPAQIQFTNHGDVLVVTEKATSTIDTFAVDKSGTVSAARSFASSGSTPFGFAVARHDRIVVSEAAGGSAGLSAASSYGIGDDGTVTAITRSAATTQAAACWVAVTKNGRYAFTANAASDSISTFAVGDDGSLSLVAAQAAHYSGAHTTDLDTSRDSKFLYAVDGGTHMLSAFRIRPDGLLDRLPGVAIPVGALGVAAR